MVTVDWTTALAFNRDPSDIEVYRFNYLDWLDGEEIATFSIVSEANDTIVTEIVGQTTTTVDVKVSAGTNQYDSKITARVTSTGTGRRMDRSIRFTTFEH